jgi:hypothetical protein
LVKLPTSKDWLQEHLNQEIVNDEDGSPKVVMVVDDLKVVMDVLEVP